MDHLIGFCQRIVRAERIVGHIQVEPRLFGKAKRFSNGIGAGRADHSAADDKEIRFPRPAPVPHRQHRAAHNLEPGDLDLGISQLGNPISRILPFFLRDELVNASVPPVFQAGQPGQPLKRLV